MKLGAYTHIQHKLRGFIRKYFINELIKGSLLFITAHSVKDQKYYRYSKEMKPIGKNSFSDGKKVRTFLEENEILGFFSNWDIEYHFEGYGPEHRHGKGPVERHHVIEVINLLVFYG